MRPAFCYWGFRAGGRTGSAIVRIGTALELLHTFALVHDDIMDDADLRRGQPTTKSRHSVDFALLVGDLAIVLADAAFASAEFPAATTAAAFEVYSRMKQEVVVGQLLDYEMSRSPVASKDKARRVALLKSGLYSVVEPLSIGAVFATASHETIEALRRFGIPLGEAFQLRDDLLGLFGDAGSVGKPVGSDVREGKRNLLFVLTSERLAGRERERFLERWGAPDLDDDEVTALTEVVEESGARGEVEDLLGELHGEAHAALDGIKDADARGALADLAGAATYRQT